jgi:glycosyltransferase involved in cell wall biosynthesis
VGKLLQTISFVGNLRVAGDGRDGVSLNIAYVVPGVGISGGINVILEYAHRLARRGHQVFLLNIDSQVSDASWHPIKGLKIYNLDDIAILRYIAAIDFDVLVVTGWQTVYEILRLKLRARTFAYFVQCDEILFNPKGSWNARLSSLTYRLPFQYLTISKWLVNWLKTEYGQNAVYVPNRYNPAFVYQTEPLAAKDPDRVRILLEGALHNPWKRMDHAFLAVQGLNAEIWCLSSGGKLQPWQRPHRFFSGVPYDRVGEIMSSCDILVKLSEIEGFFGPPLEMMACGGTAVVSKVPGYDEYIADGINALTVEVGDFRGARAHLARLIEDRHLLERLKRGGAETARAFSDWEESVTEVEEFFLRLTAEAGPAGPTEFSIPDDLADVAELAVDVRFSRDSDNPWATRRNWRTLRSWQPVRMSLEEGTALVQLSGRCPAGQFEEVRLRGATNLDATCRLAPVTADTSRAATSDAIHAFAVSGVVEVDPGFSGSLPECIQALASDRPAVEGVRRNGTASRLPFAQESTGAMPANGAASIDAVSCLRCYAVSVDLSPPSWPEEQGDNYAVILGFFCDSEPRNIILYAPSRERVLRYPSMRLEPVAEGPGGFYVRIDTIAVYPGWPSYEFLMFIDVDAYAATVQPGALR